MGRKRLEILIYMGWTHSLNHGLFIAITPLIPMIVLEGHSYFGIGFLLSVYLLLYSFGSLFSAPLLRLLEDRKILFFSIMVQGASTLFLFIPRLTGLILFIVSSGVSASLYHPVSNIFIFNRFRNKVNLAMGLHGTGGNLVQFVFPPLSFFLAANLGWRVALIIIGLIVSSSSIPYLTASQAKKMERDIGVFKSFVRVASQRSLLLLICFSILFGLCYRGVEVFLPTYLNLEKGFSEEASSIILSILLLAGALGQYLGGVMADRLNEAIVILSASLLGLTLLTLLPIASGHASVMLISSLLGLAFYSHQPAANSLLGKMSMEDLRTYSYSIWFFLSFLSSSPSTLVISFIGQQFGFSAAILSLNMVALIPLVLAIHIYCKSKR